MRRTALHPIIIILIAIEIIVICMGMVPIVSIELDAATKLPLLLTMSMPVIFELTSFILIRNIQFNDRKQT